LTELVETREGRPRLTRKSGECSDDRVDADRTLSLEWLDPGGSYDHDTRCTFIEDGAQAPDQVVRAVIAFIEKATETLDIAIYDFHANVGATAAIAVALRTAAGRGVRVRVSLQHRDLHERSRCSAHAV
jgi:phosphatidylserine/phosphatidylglycerophosphate/cardiolipin synthase-like enzyme